MQHLQEAISKASGARLALSASLAAIAKDDLASSDLRQGGKLAPELGPANPPPFDTSFHGIPIHVDRPKGFVQRGTDPEGNLWERTYKTDYGYVPGIESLGEAVTDGEELDVYLGPNEEAEDAHIILQVKRDGTPDELKVMLGFRTAKAAKAMYLAHGPEWLFGGMGSLPVSMLKALLGIGQVEASKAIASIAKMLWSTRALAPIEIFAEKRDVRLVGIKKAIESGEEQRFVLAIVLEPEVVDAQGDIYSADEIRKAQRRYMRDFQNVGLNHKQLVNGRANVVESWIAPLDMEIEGSTIRKGTWMIGIEILDDMLWQKAKSGELTGVSIGGLASRDPIP